MESASIALMPTLALTPVLALTLALTLALARRKALRQRAEADEEFFRLCARLALVLRERLNAHRVRVYFRPGGGGAVYVVQGAPEAAARAAFEEILDRSPAWLRGRVWLEVRP